MIYLVTRRLYNMTGDRHFMVARHHPPPTFCFRTSTGTCSWARRTPSRAPQRRRNRASHLRCFRKLPPSKLRSGTCTSCGASAGMQAKACARIWLRVGATPRSWFWMQIHWYRECSITYLWTHRGSSNSKSFMGLIAKAAKLEAGASKKACSTSFANLSRRDWLGFWNIVRPLWLRGQPRPRMKSTAMLVE